MPEVGKLGFQYMTQAETLWHMRAQMNNSLYAAAGGNVLNLICPDAQVGMVVRHTGGENAAIGYQAGGQCVYGVVLSGYSVTSTMLVKILGEAKVRCTGTAWPGQLALVREDGTIDAQDAKNCTEPERIIGVVSSTAAAGRCSVVLGQGRMCAAASPLSAKFITGTNETTKMAAFAACQIVVPSLNIYGDFVTGIESAEYGERDTQIVLKFAPGRFVKPPMVFGSLITASDYRLCTLPYMAEVPVPEGAPIPAEPEYFLSNDGVVLQVFAGNTPLKLSTLNLSINIMAVGEV